MLKKEPLIKLANALGKPVKLFPSESFCVYGSKRINARIEVSSRAVPKTQIDLAS